MHTIHETCKIKEEYRSFNYEVGLIITAAYASYRTLEDRMGSALNEKTDGQI